MAGNEGRYVAVTGQGEVALETAPRPTVHPADAVARVLYAGVCGTDIHLIDSPQPFPWKEKSYPFRLGHEWVGELEEIGKDFPEYDAYGNKLLPGDRAVVYPSTWACGKCFACRVLLAPNLCLRPGFHRPLPPDMSAFADWFYIPEGSMLFRVPDEVDSELAALTEPMAVALRALERAYLPGVPDRYQGLGPGKSVVILGSGTIGALIAALARGAGCFPVIVVGGPENRLTICRELGAHRTFDITATTGQERQAMIRDETLHRLGADIVFEAAGSPRAFADAIEICRPGGTLVELGHYTDHGTVEINPLNICRKDIHLFGCWGFGPQQFGEALRVLAADMDRYRKIITHRFQLSQIAEAVKAARNQESLKAMVKVS